MTLTRPSDVEVISDLDKYNVSGVGAKREMQKKAETESLN